MAIKVLIDTDMAQDDWIAILMLLQSPKVEVVGISVVGTGEVECGPGIENTKKLLNLVNYKPIPIGCHDFPPLLGTLNQMIPEEWVTGMNTLLGYSLPSNPRYTHMESSTAVFQEVLNKHSDVTILTLGPLTFMAEFFDKYPQYKSKVSRVVSMAGNLKAPGSVHHACWDNTKGELNVFCDPLAAKRFFHSGLPIELVALDATCHTLTNAQFFQYYASLVSSPVSRFVQHIISHISAKGDNPEAIECFWDAVAAAVLLDPSMARGRKTHVDVHWKDRGHGDLDPATAGIMTEDPNGPHLVLFYDWVDKAAFFQLFVQLTTGV